MNNSTFVSVGFGLVFLGIAGAAVAGSGQPPSPPPAAPHQAGPATPGQTQPPSPPPAADGPAGAATVGSITAKPPTAPGAAGAPGGVTEAEIHLPQGGVASGPAPGARLNAAGGPKVDTQPHAVQPMPAQ